MSLILEALRKSEAERRRGRAPDLHTELPPAHARSRRILPPWLWIAAATALLLVAALLWMRGRNAPESAARDEQKPAANTVQEARAPVDDREPAITSPPPFPRVDRIAAPPAEPAPMPAPAASPTPRAEEQDEDDIIAAAPARETIATPTAPAPAVAATDAPPSPANAPTSAPTPTRDAIARLSELPPEERKQLPAMKLSMHMWNERPAQRFVIIDGQRYVEGDRIGSAVVDAIDSDGVILDLNGRAVRVPIR
jgi:general secretion pathway protein B